MLSLAWNLQSMLLATLLLLPSHVPILAAAEPHNLPQNGSLLAPVYRPVEIGNAWVFPNSSFDLGARSMSCECFDPSGSSAALTDNTSIANSLPTTSETCCMPKFPTILPFCAVQNETCCANTYCLAGETCCGDFCCPFVRLLSSASPFYNIS